MKSYERKIAIKDKYDLIIVGGGIYGASLLWEATKLGLSAILVEKKDFGSGTSANSLKIIHGGLRYLQQLDLTRMRESIRERRNLMQDTPHLLATLPCITPTYHAIRENRLVYKLAFALNDLISIDRNRGCDKLRSIPSGHLVSSKECAKLIPGLQHYDITGGAVWYDAQAINTERLLLLFINRALDKGNDAFNYMEMSKILFEGKRVVGIIAKNVLTNKKIEILGRNTVIAAGPWINDIKKKNPKIYRGTNFHFAKAVNFIIPWRMSAYAFGLKDTAATYENGNSKRLLFFVPWRDGTIIGTWYFRTEENTAQLGLKDYELEACLKSANAALQSQKLSRDQISFVHVGMVPCHPSEAQIQEPQIGQRPVIIDHKRMDGIEGIVSVIGVKYTTARSVSERVLKLIDRRRSKNQIIDNTGKTEKEFFYDCINHPAPHTTNAISDKAIRHILINFGPAASQVLRIASADNRLTELVPGADEVIKAELEHIIENESTVTLSDLLLRRTDLGTLKKPAEKTIEFCARFMADKLSWGNEKKAQEIDGFLKTYQFCQRGKPVK